MASQMEHFLLWLFSIGAMVSVAFCIDVKIKKMSSGDTWIKVPDKNNHTANSNWGTNTEVHFHAHEYTDV